MTAPMQHPWQRWSKHGCSVPDCTARPVTVDAHNGRRCADHAPTFDPQRAVDLYLDGFPDTAAAYIRTDFGEVA